MASSLNFLNHIYIDIIPFLLIASIVTTNLEALTTEYLVQVEIAQKLEQKKKVLEEEKLEADTELDNQRDTLNNREREYDAKMKEFELQKEREVTLMGDRFVLRRFVLDRVSFLKVFINLFTVNTINV